MPVSSHLRDKKKKLKIPKQNHIYLESTVQLNEFLGTNNDVSYKTDII